MAQQTEHGKKAYGLWDKAWHPVVGCDESLPCAKHCWAKRTVHRLAHAAHEGVRKAHEGLVRVVNTADGTELQWTGEVRLNEAHLLDPLRWQKDVTTATGFHGDLALLPERDIERIFAMMAWCSMQKFFVLTKRPDRLLEFLAERSKWPPNGLWNALVAEHFIGWEIHGAKICARRDAGMITWPLPNVRIGTSASTQPELDARMRQMKKLQAAGWRTFLMLEPLLGPVDAGPYVDYCVHCDKHGIIRTADGRHARCGRHPGLEQVIVGGESGSGARPCRIEWIESIVEQCDMANVPCFVKQLGSYPVWASAKASPINPSQGKNHDPNLWPESLRMREFPNANR